MTETTSHQGADPRAPKPEHRPTERTFHGDTVIDEYEWMRDKTDPDVIAHLEAENAYADLRTAHLDSLRKTLVAEFAGHTKETDLSVPVRRGGYWYLTRTTQGHDHPRFTRALASEDLPMGPGGVPEVDADALLPGEEVILDAQALSEGHEFFSLGGTTTSDDERLLAYAVDVTGGELYDLVITDMATGATVDDAVRSIGYGLAFSADGRFVFYARRDEAWRQNEIWRHEIGTPADSDVLVAREDDEMFDIGFELSRDHSTLVIGSVSKTTSEMWLLDMADPTGELRPVAGRTHGVEYAVEPAGDRLLILHNRDHEGFALSEAPLDAPDEWTLLLAAGEGERLESVDAFAKAAAVELRGGALPRLLVIPRREDGSLDVDAAWTIDHGGELDAVWLDTNPEWEAPALRYVLTSMLTPKTVAQADLASGERTVLRRTEVPNFDPDRYVERRLWATAADGTKIPLSVAMRREVEADGTNPGYLYGYGSYEASMDPALTPTWLSMMDRGVVTAIAHIRGGGEMGRPWYFDGKLLNKKNTFSDFVAAADMLVADGWVAPDRLAAEGGSAGGLLMGAVANLAPERFRAIIAGVPFVDALTTILDPSLPLTVSEWEEWGDPLHDPEVYRYMKEYTPYENIREAEYPAIFASTSLNDTRVFFVEPAKWIARLRETVTNDQEERPIVFRCEMVAGHGGRSGRYARWEQRADEMAWLLDQLGATELIG